MFLTNKKILLYGLMFVAGSGIQTIKAIKLQNTLIRVLDGVPGALDKVTIQDMVHIYGEMRKMQFGIKNKITGAMEGMFTVNGIRYSVHDLARIEFDIDQECARKKELVYDLYLNRSAFDMDWDKIESALQKEYARELQEREEAVCTMHRSRHDDDAQENLLLNLELGKVRRVALAQFDHRKEQMRQETLRRHTANKEACEEALFQIEEERKRALAVYLPALLEAKAEFKRINGPYMASLQGTRAMMEMLIEESCQARGRNDSFLLTLSQVPEGQEMQSFDRNIISFRLLDICCTDLTNFLSDVISSCPIACSQAGLNIK